MNIFFLHESPELSAKYLVDKHIVKMPLESAQMLSTAHRLLDGAPQVISSEKNGKIKLKKHYVMPNETSSSPISLYKVAHAKHPSTVWTMESGDNYHWHFELFCHMLKEYSRRYGRVHASARLLPLLASPPQNIPKIGPTQPVPAMPDLYKVPGNYVESYRRYYAGEKWRFAKWKNPIAEDVPGWFTAYMDIVWKDERYAERLAHVEKISKRKTLPLNSAVFNYAVALSQC